MRRHPLHTLILPSFRCWWALLLAASIVLALDRRLQTEVAYQQPGLLRRTTARGEDGSWLVIQLWRSDAEVERLIAAAEGRA